MNLRFVNSKNDKIYKLIPLIAILIFLLIFIIKAFGINCLTLFVFIGD